MDNVKTYIDNRYEFNILDLKLVRVFDCKVESTPYSFNNIFVFFDDFFSPLISHTYATNE